MISGWFECSGRQRAENVLNTANNKTKCWRESWRPSSLYEREKKTQRVEVLRHNISYCNLLWWIYGLLLWHFPQIASYFLLTHSLSPSSCFNKILVKFARGLECISRGDELNNSRTERWALFHVISSTWLIQSSNAMWFSLVVLIRHWTNYMHSRHGGNTNTNIKTNRQMNARWERRGEAGRECNMKYY